MSRSIEAFNRSEGQLLQHPAERVGGTPQEPHLRILPDTKINRANHPIFVRNNQQYIDASGQTKTHGLNDGAKHPGTDVDTYNNSLLLGS